jgi:formylglycine-generating enzyme required for sulfatase activity
MKKGLFPCMLMVTAVFIGGCSKSPVGSKPNPTIFPTMINIPAGTFQMGDTNSAIDAIPVHSVTLGAFTMSKTLITQEQYAAVMGVNPSYFDSGSTWPVDQVNWYEAVWFCNKLSKLAGLDTVYTYTGIYEGSGGIYKVDTLTSVAIDYTKNGYRLPTEAEYEYANAAPGTTRPTITGGGIIRRQRQRILWR